MLLWWWLGPGQRDGPAQALVGGKFPSGMGLSKFLPRESSHYYYHHPVLSSPKAWEHLQQRHHWWAPTSCPGKGTYSLSLAQCGPHTLCFLSGPRYSGSEKHSPIVTTAGLRLRLSADRVVTAKGLTMVTSVLSLRDEST